MKTLGEYVTTWPKGRARHLEAALSARSAAVASRRSRRAAHSQTSSWRHPRTRPTNARAVLVSARVASALAPRVVTTLRASLPSPSPRLVVGLGEGRRRRRLSSFSVTASRETSSGKFSNKAAASRGAVVAEQFATKRSSRGQACVGQRGVRHRVDGLVGNDRVHVEQVEVRGILRRSRRPQWPLDLGAARRRGGDVARSLASDGGRARRPPATCALAVVPRRGSPSGRSASTATSTRETKNDATLAIVRDVELRRARRRLETLHPGGDDVVVAIQGEDQGDVDVDAERRGPR